MPVTANRAIGGTSSPVFASELPFAELAVEAVLVVFELLEVDAVLVVLEPLVVPEVLVVLAVLLGAAACSHCAVNVWSPITVYASPGWYSEPFQYRNL